MHIVVPVDQDQTFVEYTKTMYGTTSKHIFDAAVKSLLEAFPKTEAWVRRWTRQDIARMIFKSQQVLLPDFADHQARTTNGVEAFHRDLYRIVQKDKPIVPTLREIFQYLSNDEANLAQFQKVFTVDYKKTAPK